VLNWATDKVQLKYNVARLAVLVEEQNARNKVVLDGLTSLFHSQDFDCEL
jgi:hypothetical protein